MTVVTIEAEPDTTIRTCEKCGGANHLPNGWIYVDGDASGVSFLEWCEGLDSDRSAQLTLSLGPYGDGTEAGGRAAFCVESSESGMRLTDVPSRDHPDLLGVFVPETRRSGATTSLRSGILRRLDRLHP